jgi:hypothetical protein
MSTVNVTTQPGAPYTWNSNIAWDSPDANKTWDNLYSGSYSIETQEALALSEIHAEIITWNKKFAETLKILDKSLDTFKKYIKENIVFVDGYIDLIQFNLRIMETMTLSDGIAKQQILKQLETIQFTEKNSKDFKKYNYEVISLVEKNIKQLLLAKVDTFGFSEFAERDIAKYFNSNVSISESNPIKQINKNIKEYLTTADNYVDYISFALRIMENILINEKNTKSVTRPIKTEGFGITDKIINSPTINAKQTLSISEQENNLKQFKRIFDETLLMVDKIAKDLKITQKEGLILMSTIIRNANAVLSDLYLTNSELTLEDFQSLSMPIGYEEFTDFLAGDLEYQRAMIKIILEAGITTDRPAVEEWKLNIDVPDITDRGTSTVPIGGIRVNFNRMFYNPPEVMTRTTGGTGSSAPIPDITSTDKYGFDVVLKENGESVKGSISWVAQGY